MFNFPLLYLYFASHHLRSWSWTSKKCIISNFTHGEVAEPVPHTWWRRHRRRVIEACSAKKSISQPQAAEAEAAAPAATAGASWNSRAVRRGRGFPSAFLPTLAPAPPNLSSSPVSLPAQFGAAGVMQNPWFQHLDDPVVLPTVTGRQSPKNRVRKSFCWGTTEGSNRKQ